MKITSKLIHQIAEELESGMKIYLNRETLEIKSILDWDDSFSDNDFWKEEVEKIENEWSDYIVLTKMESHEAFKIMENFVDEVNDQRLQEDLIKILNRKSPFANFKDEVETSSYRQQWFDFRIRKYEDYVKELLEMEDFEIE